MNSTITQALLCAFALLFTQAQVRFCGVATFPCCFRTSLMWLSGTSLTVKCVCLQSLQELCDLEPFIERSIDGLPPCKTCFFPTYPDIDKINVSHYKPLDLSHEWIYFHGDSTLRQVYGEFYSIVHKTQVPDILLRCLTRMDST